MILNAFKKAIKTCKDRNYNTVYIAVDLHDTIFPSTYSTRIDLEPFEYAFETLEMWSKLKDVKLILFTSSYDKNIKVYLNKMKANNINFDFVNENPEIENSDFGDFSKKFYYNLLIDDKAGFEPETEWNDLYEYMRNC